MLWIKPHRTRGESMIGWKYFSQSLTGFSDLDPKGNGLKGKANAKALKSWYANEEKLMRKLVRRELKEVDKAI